MFAFLTVETYSGSQHVVLSKIVSFTHHRDCPNTCRFGGKHCKWILFYMAKLGNFLYKIEENCPLEDISLSIAIYYESLTKSIGWKSTDSEGW